ncbi:DUF3995 domain-containing protein [Actinokineospora sp.]|uniref:DUF3995 domain-containing protein n=1 Tax=Actinokineospora sp. TaxID=1872133 RepID=UPI004037E2F4
MTVVGGIAAVALVLVGALHVVWMFSTWPVQTRAEFARRVVDVPEERLPSPPLTGAVAFLLFAGGYLVAARAGIVGGVGPDWLVPAGAATVAAVLLLRGLSGLAVSARRDTEFAWWDLRIYAPLCVVLGGLCAAVALGANPSG